MMMESGEIQCPDGSDDIPYCPSGCSICDTCLTLLGCSETRPNDPIRDIFSMNIFWYLLAAVLGIALGVIAMSVHKKGSSPKSMQANLVQGSATPGGDDNVWLAPVT